MKKVFLKNCAKKFREGRLYLSPSANFRKILRNTYFARHLQTADYEPLQKYFQ